MKTVLIVDPDKKLPGLVIDGLKAYGAVTTRQTRGLIVKAASNGKEGVGVLNRFKVDLVVTDIGGPAMDGFDLLAYMNQGGYRDIPVIAVTAASTPEIKDRLAEMGVTNCLKKPFVLLELLEKILDVLDESSKALISDFTVPNFLQALQMEEKTCTLEITSKEKIGYLHLEKGELIDAQTNGLTGNDAAIEILGWEDTELKVEELSSQNKKISASLMQILMQAAQAKDEKAHVVSPSDTALAEIVSLAEGRHFAKAQEKLATFLKANRKSHDGWLWYSRITRKVEAIEKSLNNAKTLAPDNPEVAAEVDKFEVARKLLEGEQIWRCPFCWAPLNLAAFECPYCRVSLTVDEDLLTRPKSADQQILEQAIDRYARVVTREVNPEASYYLGMAHLNLEEWEKGLDQLYNTVENSPQKEFYYDQLQMLMSLFTSSENIFTQETTVKGIGSDLASARVEKTGQKTVLVVENSPTIRKAVSIALSLRGHNVIQVGDGLEALNFLDKKRPDIILIDMVLPKLDAEQVLLILQNSSELSNIPVVLLTNKEGLVSRMKRKLAGSSAEVTKPFELSKLIEITEKHLI